LIEIGEMAEQLCEGRRWKREAEKSSSTTQVSFHLETGQKKLSCQIRS